MAKEWVNSFSSWLQVDVNDTSIEAEWEATKPGDAEGDFKQYFPEVRSCCAL